MPQLERAVGRLVCSGWKEEWELRDVVGRNHSFQPPLDSDSSTLNRSSAEGKLHTLTTSGNYDVRQDA